LEDKFLALEIEEELQNLKEQSKNQANTPHHSPSCESQSPPSNQNIIRAYKILGLNPGASLKEVKQAYKQLVKKCHPDLFYPNAQMQQKAQEILTKVNQAYELLDTLKD